MTAKPNAPIIIKRKKVIAGGGHHGGAWKVAYADFVTAMMAFFLLMWLLNATTEQQRKGLADYFAPTIQISRTSGGADGMFAGTNILSEDTLVMSATGAQIDPGEIQVQGGGEMDAERAAAMAAEVDALQEMEDLLLGKGGESLFSDEAVRHIVTRVTDEGLVIELFSLPEVSLFVDNGTEPAPVTRELLGMIARVANVVANPISIEAHVPAQPIVYDNAPVWALTSDRVDAARQEMEDAGLMGRRVQRMTGHGDRSPLVEDPLSVRNDRLEIIILRTAF